MEELKNAILNIINVPTLDHMPEAVKTAAAAEKAAAELEKAKAADLEKANANINSAIKAGDIAAAQAALKTQSKAAAEREKAKAAHKTAAAELEKAKEENPYRQPTAADYCIAAAVELLRNGEKLNAKAVATAAIALMPEGGRPSTPNGTEMTARGVIAVITHIKPVDAIAYAKVDGKMA